MHPAKEEVGKIHAQAQGRSETMHFDRLDDGNEINDSQDWIKCIDRGGLTHVNNVCI